MWHRFAGLALAAGTLVASSAPSMAGQALGVWLTDEGKAKVRISTCGEGLCSRIIWVRQANDESGQPLRDYYNPDPKLKSRPIVGLPIMSDLKQSGANQWSGRIYNPENGKTYTAELTVVEPDAIILKGCSLKGWPCGEKRWVRTEDPKRDAEPSPPVVVVEVPPPPVRRPATIVAEQSAPPLPLRRPGGRTGPAPGEQTVAQVASNVTTRPQTPPTAIQRRPQPMTLAAADAGYVVQVAARKSEADALAAFDKLQQRFPGILGAHEANVQRADLGAKGVWYRLRIGPIGERGTANDLCRKLRAAGGPACFVRLETPRPGAG